MTKRTKRYLILKKELKPLNKLLIDEAFDSILIFDTNETDYNAPAMLEATGKITSFTNKNKS